MRVSFLGGAQTVTGSKFLVQQSGKNILIDCGLYQGRKELRLRNWHKLPFALDKLDAVILTHAHIDHSGYVPLLYRNGFKGPIYATQATVDLCSILLPDSGHLQEEEALYANKKHCSKHKPALPLYTRLDAIKSLERFIPIKFNQSIDLGEGIHFYCKPAGHILGAATVYLSQGDKRLMFTGDLGRQHDSILYPPAPPDEVDYIFCESTYGNREHVKGSSEDELAAIINSTVAKGGSILMPAFAVGRAQHVLRDVYYLKKNKRIPDIPVFVDSPMATDVTKLFYQHADLHQLSKDEALGVCKTATYIQSVDDSKSLMTIKYPHIIISASGMATGGRVLHHLSNLLPDHRNSIVFCGFQAPGTRGARLVQGEKEVKIFGQYVSVRSSIYNLETLSAHADRQEIISWLKKMKSAPKKIFIIHGELDASTDLAYLINHELGWKTEIPDYNSNYEI